MIAISHVQLAKNCSPIKPLKELIKSRQWVIVTHCLTIERSVVNAHTQPTILLFCKEDGSPICSIGYFYTTTIKKFTQLLFQLFQLFLVKWVEFAFGGRSIFINQWYAMFYRIGTIRPINWVSRLTEDLSILIF